MIDPFTRLTETELVTCARLKLTPDEFLRQKVRGIRAILTRESNEPDWYDQAPYSIVARTGFRERK